MTGSASSVTGSRVIISEDELAIGGCVSGKESEEELESDGCVKITGSDDEVKLGVELLVYHQSFFLNRLNY